MSKGELALMIIMGCLFGGAAIAAGLTMNNAGTLTCGVVLVAFAFWMSVRCKY